MRDRPSQGWDTWQRVQIFKEESTESHFPWPIYPSLIIECFDDAYLTPCRHFASSIGFRENGENLYDADTLHHHSVAHPPQQLTWYVLLVGLPANGP